MANRCLLHELVALMEDVLAIGPGLLLIRRYICLELVCIDFELSLDCFGRIVSHIKLLYLLLQLLHSRKLLLDCCLNGLHSEG